MAKGTSARLKVDGEKEFNETLKTMAAQLRAANSELKLIAKTFEGQEKSVESLTAAQSAYQKQNDVLAKQVELLRGKVAAAADEYGENSRQVANLRDKLNKAETEFIESARAVERLDKELEEAKEEAGGFGKAVDDLDQGAKGLGDVLDQLSGKFGISLPDNMRESMNGMIQIDAKSLALVGGMAALATEIVNVEKKLISLTKEAATAADEILTMSTITGISTQALQEYQYAAELMDVSVETITDSQTKLIRSMQDAQQGADAQIDAFDRLGVSYQNSDGSLRNAQDVYWDTVDALGRMANETERDAVAMEVLGRSARDLNPLIEAGSDRMKELADEAHEVGYVLEEEDLAALGKVDDAMQRLDKSTEALNNRLAVEFAPYLEESTKNLTGFVEGLGGSLKDSGIVKAFGMLLETFSGLLTPADTLANKSLPGVTAALKPLAQLLAGIASTVELLASILDIRTLFSDPGGYVERVYTATGIGYQYGYKNQIQQLEDYYTGIVTNNATDASGYGQYYANGTYYANKDAYLRELYAQSGYGGTFEAWKSVNGHNASGNFNFGGGWSWVGENGPELVRLPRETQILSAQESREAVGDTYITVTINADNVREFNDIIRIVENARMNARKRG